MPYRRGYKKSKRGYKRKRKTARKVPKSIKRYVKRAIAIAPEHHFVELSTFTDYALGGAFTTRLTNMPVMGDDVNTRTGNMVHLKALRCVIQLTGPITPVATGYAAFSPECQIRMIFGLYKKAMGLGLPTANGPLSSNCILDTTIALGWQAPYNTLFRSAWTLLSDRTYQVNGMFAPDAGQAIDGNQGVRKTFTKTFSLKNKKMTFRANTNAVADIETNLPFLVIMSNLMAATYPAITMYCRMTFAE